MKTFPFVDGKKMILAALCYEHRKDSVSLDRVFSYEDAGFFYLATYDSSNDKVLLINNQKDKHYWIDTSRVFIFFRDDSNNIYPHHLSSYIGELQSGVMSLVARKKYAFNDMNENSDSYTKKLEYLITTDDADLVGNYYESKKEFPEIVKSKDMDFIKSVHVTVYLKVADEKEQSSLSYTTINGNVELVEARFSEHIKGLGAKDYLQAMSKINKISDEMLEKIKELT